MKSVGFESETQLVKAIVTCSQRARRREYRTELEVDAGVGIADLVFAKRAARSTNALRALAKISPRLAVLLSHDVAAVVTSRETLANSLGTNESGAQRVLAQLATAGLVFGTPKAFSLATISTLPFEKVVAVEAKLSEWKRVLVQAYRNLQFADESWVVLDHSCVRPALAQLERFQATGVGLASMDRNLGLFVHLSAAPAGPMSATRRWQAQAVLAARAVARRSPSKGV